MNSVALWPDLPSPTVVPFCRPCADPRIPPGGLDLPGGRSAVGTLQLECSLCRATSSQLVLGDDLDDLAVEAVDHLTRHHPHAPAGVLVMHQHSAWGHGTPERVAQWVRGLRSSIDVPLTA